MISASPQEGDTGKVFSPTCSTALPLYPVGAGPSHVPVFACKCTDFVNDGHQHLLTIHSRSRESQHALISRLPESSRKAAAHTTANNSHPAAGLGAVSGAGWFSLRIALIHSGFWLVHEVREGAPVPRWRLASIVGHSAPRTNWAHDRGRSSQSRYVRCLSRSLHSMLEWKVSAEALLNVGSWLVYCRPVFWGGRGGPLLARCSTIMPGCQQLGWSHSNSFTGTRSD